MITGYLGVTWVCSDTDENTLEAKWHFSSLIPDKSWSNVSVNVNGDSDLPNLGYSVLTYLFIT